MFLMIVLEHSPIFSFGVLGVGQISNTGTDNVHCPFGGGSGWGGGGEVGVKVVDVIILKNRKIQKWNENEKNLEEKKMKRYAIVDL